MRKKLGWKCHKVTMKALLFITMQHKKKAMQMVKDL